MRLRLVGLAVSRQRPAGIEITQRREMQSVDLPVPIQGLLHHQLCVAVDVGRTERRVLRQRLFARLVHCCRRGKDKAPDPSADRSFYQRQRVRKVVVIEAPGILHAFTGFDEGGEVHHRIELLVRQGFGQCRAVRQVRFDKACSFRHRRTVTRNQ